MESSAIYGTRARPGALRSLGGHPDDNEKVEVYGGRYGAYVKHGKTNATIPPEMTTESITLDQALGLIAERETKGGGKKKKVAKKAPAKKAAGKKKPNKKAANKAVKKAVAKAA